MLHRNVDAGSAQGHDCPGVVEKGRLRSIGHMTDNREVPPVNQGCSVVEERLTCGNTAGQLSASSNEDVPTPDPVPVDDVFP